MNLPIGYDNFGKIIEKKLTFVDKSLMIKDLIDDEAAEVTLITRPRRFGKTLNLSMLHYFFAAEAYGQSTRGMFDHLKIAQQGEAYMRHQGQYPVITITFKDIKDGKFEPVYASLCQLLSRTYTEHIAILDNPNIASHEKKNYEAILEAVANQAVVESSLLKLSHYLYQHYGVKPILLIDEYDTPIHSGYVHGYYDQIVGLMRHLFGAVLKNNPYLNRAILTGILRVSKESLFSGLNNLRVYSVLRPEYSQYFGFTEEEMDQLLKQAELKHSAEDIKAWYNGYQFGDTVIYNPWSIANCLKEKGALRPYWVNTSDNSVIKRSLMQTSAEFKLELEGMLKGIPAERLIDENVVFGDLNTNELAVWSLLLESGYLKAIETVQDAESAQIKCRLLPPNQEVIALYKDIVQAWFSDPIGQGGYQSLLKDLLTGNIEDFTKRLQDFLLETASQFDVKGKHPEKFYHGFVLGLMASLEKTHYVKSNRESGYGRYDVMLIPKDQQQRGIIMEFKNADDLASLSSAAKAALAQIKQRSYAKELQQAGINSILQLGLAFYGKDVVIVYEEK